MVPMSRKLVPLETPNGRLNLLIHSGTAAGSQFGVAKVLEELYFILSCVLTPNYERRQTSSPSRFSATQGK
jgi:hypothetical protein